MVYWRSTVNLWVLAIAFYQTAVDRIDVVNLETYGTRSFRDRAITLESGTPQNSRSGATDEVNFGTVHGFTP